MSNTDAPRRVPWADAQRQPRSGTQDCRIPSWLPLRVKPRHLPTTPALVGTTYYTMPWAIIALATLRKPAMLAPATRLPAIPYASAASRHWS